VKDDLYLLFPSPVLVTENLISEDENNEIAKHILLEKDNVAGTGKDVWYSGTSSPKNSFGSEYSNPIFKNLLEQIDERTKEYARRLKFQEWRVKTRDWWWNVYENGNHYQEFHGHVPFYFSGVYFCKIPKGSSSIVFRHPNFNHYVPAYEKNEYNAECKAIEPTERTLLIFPSNLVHCVPPGTNKDPRITISFNYGGMV
jgi:uncharacterized protein (TIGR02466 family)